MRVCCIQSTLSKTNTEYVQYPSINIWTLGSTSGMICIWIIYRQDSEYLSTSTVLYNYSRC